LVAWARAQQPQRFAQKKHPQAGRRALSITNSNITGPELTVTRPCIPEVRHISLFTRERMTIFHHIATNTGGVRAPLWRSDNDKLGAAVRIRRGEWL